MGTYKGAFAFSSASHSSSLVVSKATFTSVCNVLNILLAKVLLSPLECYCVSFLVVFSTRL